MAWISKTVLTNCSVVNSILFMLMHLGKEEEDADELATVLATTMAIYLFTVPAIALTTVCVANLAVTLDALLAMALLELLCSS